MGFDNKPGIVVKTDPNKKAIVSDSIVVYNNDHNSGDGRYTRLENGKLTYDDGQVREFNLPSTKGQGIYTLATTDDIPSLDGYATETWVQNQGYITNAALNNYITTTQLTDALDDYALKTEIPTTATSTSTSTVTPTTIELVFTYEDNTTQTITLMTGATVSTSTTTTLS